MRIALIAYACHPDRGTEPGAGWQWARHLADRGHAIELVTRDDPGGTARIREEIAARGDGRITLHVVDRPDSRTPEGVGSSPGADLRTARQYLGWLAGVDRYAAHLPAVDLVHHVTYGSVRGGSALLEVDAPHVFGPVSGLHRAAGPLRPVLGPARGRERARELHGWLSLRRPGRARRTLRRTDVVLAANSDTARGVSRWCRRVEVLPADALPASYAADAAPVRDLATPVVLWVGSLQPIKAPGLALDAFTRLRQLVPAARLRMIGTGPMTAAILDRRDALGLRDSVELPGRLPWSAMRAEYDHAAVLLFTSIRDSFGAQCLEAWSRGVPSVGFRQHGLADFAPTDGAVLVEPQEAGAAGAGLAQAMADVVSNPEVHRRMADAALAHAAGFTWEARVQNVERTYARLTGRPVEVG